MPPYLTHLQNWNALWPLPLTVLVLTAFFYGIVRPKEEKRELILLLAAFSMLGLVTGYLTGFSRSPAVGAVLPAVLSLVAGLAVFLMGKDASSRVTVSLSVLIFSAFRSIDRQAEIVRRKLETGAAVESILTVCAPPGFSEHHTGRAVDLSTPSSRALEVEFDQTAAYVWLTEHAAEFSYYLSYPTGNPWGESPRFLWRLFGLSNTGSIRIG